MLLLMVNKVMSWRGSICRPTGGWWSWCRGRRVERLFRETIHPSIPLSINKYQMEWLRLLSSSLVKWWWQQHHNCHHMHHGIDTGLKVIISRLQRPFTCY